MMKEQEKNRLELFKVVFNKDEKFSKQQLSKSKELFHKQTVSKERKQQIFKVQELQHRLAKRRASLLGEALGTDKISEDKEVTELADQLKSLYKDLKKEQEEYNLSLEDCPKLPPLDDFMSRININNISDLPPLLNAYYDTETAGTDDYFLEGTNIQTVDVDEAEANANGGRFHVSANSKSSPNYITVLSPVEARATLVFPLKPKITTQYSELVVQAHLFGGYEGDFYSDVLLGSQDPTNYTRAWIKMNLEVWDGYWKVEDSKQMNLIDMENLNSGSVTNESIRYTTFNQDFTVKSDAVNQKFPALFRVALTFGVEVLSDPGGPNIGFWGGYNPPSYSSASALLDVVLCALDVGLVPINTFPGERSLLNLQ